MGAKTTCWRRISACSGCPFKSEPARSLGTPFSADVMWVGVSAKPRSTSLDPRTPTGRVVSRIEERLSQVRFYRTNLVKCPTTDPSGRMRVPVAEEIQRCLALLRSEIDRVRPCVVVGLGTVVSRALFEWAGGDWEFNGFGNRIRYRVYSSPQISLLPVHHPSYMLVYRRRKIEHYIDCIARAIHGAVSPFSPVARNR
jgi:uracil-DNA glycosylase